MHRTGFEPGLPLAFGEEQYWAAVIPPVAGVQLFPDEVLKSAGQMVPAHSQIELLPVQQGNKVQHLDL